MLSISNRNGSQSRAGILGNVAVGADVGEQCVHGLFSQVDAVAAHIAAFGIAGGAVLQHLGTVQELPVVILAHLYQGFVVFIHLGLGQVLVGMLLAQRRNGVHNDIHTGVSILHSLDALGIVADKAGSAVIGAQIIGAKGQDHAAGLHQGNGFRHRLVATVAFKLCAGICCQCFS